MTADGASPDSSPEAPSRSSTTRRSRRVSSASGVTCPPFASVTVAPRSMVRASISVSMSYVVIGRPRSAMCRRVVPSTRHVRPRHSAHHRRQIHARVVALAGEIRHDNPEAALHFIGVLKGSVFFMADLLRALPGQSTMDFIAVSSYASGSTSSGEVRMLKDVDRGLQDRDVIIVEDIVDTGLTLNYLQGLLRTREPRSLRTACLLSKPSRRKVEVTVDYIGFTIDDHFVVGYGLDFDERHRHLPYIGILTA